MDLLSLSARCIFSIFVLVLLTKLMGYRQISQLSFYDYVIGITIGSIAADMASDLQTNWLYTVVSMSLYAFASIGFSFWTDKSIRARRVLTGVPIVLIQHGVILENSLKKARYDLNDLLAECRTSGYFDLADIDFAVMEHTGHISFLPKETKRPVTTQDLELTPPKTGLVANLIIDGVVMPKHLKALGKEEIWLHRQLSAQGVTDAGEVLLATCDVNDQVQVYLRKNNPPLQLLE